MTYLSDLKDCLDVAKPAVETASRLIENLLGEPCRVLGGIASDTLLAWQWKNRVKIANRAGAIIDAEGIDARQVAPSFLLPWLNSAGNIDEPDLQEMWARLLATATSDAGIQQASFVSTLSQLSRDEAVLLENLCDQQWLAFRSHSGDYVLQQTTREISTEFHNEIEALLHHPSQLGLYISRLCATGLVEDVATSQGLQLTPKSGNDPPYLTIPRSDNNPYRILKLTSFGRRFLRICKKQENEISK